MSLDPRAALKRDCDAVVDTIALLSLLATMSTDSKGPLATMEQCVQQKYLFQMYAEIREHIRIAILDCNRKMRSDNCYAKGRLRQGAKRLQLRYKRNMNHRQPVESERKEAIARREWEEVCEDTAEWKLGLLRQCPKPLSIEEETKLTEDILAKIGWPATTPPDVVAKATDFETTRCMSAKLELDDAVEEWEGTEARIAELREQMPASPPTI